MRMTANAEKKVIEDTNQMIGYKPSEKNKMIVDQIRHLRMDPLVFDHTDNQKYIAVYSSIMLSISCDYPFLSREVQRQIDKKIRWQNRRMNGQTTSAGGNRSEC